MIGTRRGLLSVFGRAVGLFAWNECNKREEHIFNVYDKEVVFGGDVLRGQFYQSAFSGFVL